MNLPHSDLHVPQGRTLCPFCTPREARSGELLPDRGVQESFPVAGQLPVAATLLVGSPQAPQEGPAMGHRPLLRPVLPAQAQPVGLRRPGNQSLPPPVRLDEDRPARAGPGRYTPYDPALAQCWAGRRRKQKPPQLAPSWQRALRDQDGQCPLCREPLLFTDRIPDSPSQWETWYAAVRKVMTRQAITDDSTGRTNTASYTPTVPAVTQTADHTARTSRPQMPAAHVGCLSRVPRRVARTVLRRGGAGKRRPPIRQQEPLRPRHRIPGR
jgi:hypothetical protein